MAKVLVCGSEGSLMQAVIPKLIEDGHHVLGVDNLVRYGRRGIGGIDGYEFSRGDLTDRRFVYGVFAQFHPDYVIQAAARIYGVGGFNKHCADILGEDITLHNNVLLAAATYRTKRVVYISSSMVYENCPQDVDLPVSEDMPLRYPAPYTDYGLSKFTGERLSVAFFKQYGIPYTIWRPFNIITPYEKSEGEIGTSHVFADFFKHIVEEKRDVIPILGDGSQIRCFTWIDEVADAIAKHSFSSATNGFAYNLGNQEPVTMRHLANRIHALAAQNGFDVPKFIRFERVGGYVNDVSVRIPDVSNAKKDLDWEAKVKLDDSIQKCLDYMKGK
jgi:UDP-glucose 4-epimerase